MPLKSTRIIPVGWEQHHRPVASGTMTAKIRFTRLAGPATWPPTTDNAPAVLWEGYCRLQELNRTGQAVPADQPVTTHDYLCTVPIDQAPAFKAGEGGDTATVIECNDPVLTGRLLRVTDIQTGSLMWERDITLTDDLSQNNP